MAVTVFEISGGALTVWAEKDGPIMLKSNELYGDPVELDESEALELATLLRRLVDEIQ